MIVTARRVLRQHLAGQVLKVHGKHAALLDTGYSSKGGAVETGCNDLYDVIH